MTVFAVVREPVPEDALLKTYRGGVHPERWRKYGDCYFVSSVTHLRAIHTRQSRSLRSHRAANGFVDGADLRRRELEFENRQILAHVRFGPGPGQGYDAGLRQVAKQDLRRGPPVGRRQGGHGGVGEDVRIGGQRPKTLVDDLLLAAERTYLPIVPGLGIEAILHDGRLDPRMTPEVFQSGEGIAIADPQLSDAAGVDERFQRTPRSQGELRRRQRR